MIFKDFTFVNVGSGSKGNASFLMFKQTLIQIDMGLSLKSVKQSLEKLGKTVDDIDALLITHNHSDHIKGIDLYKGNVPLYASKNTLEQVNVNIIQAGDAITIKDIEVHVLKTSHDAPNPIGFLFILGNERLVYLTDTGVIPVSTKKSLKNCECYIIESNHDVDMLENSGRPLTLINRILCSKGHLSNQQSANYMCDFLGDKTKCIALAHLSEECNTEELALNTHLSCYKEHNIDLEKMHILALRQHEETII